MKKIVSIVIALLLVTSMTFIAPMTHAGGATIWTDKGDYTCHETVIIYGSGFAPSTQVSITVTRPDGSTNQLTVTSDLSGSFTTSYSLDGILGVYTVYATDGTNTASTTFTDTESLRIWAEAGSYVTSSSDAWIDASWVVSGGIAPGGSSRFDLYIDAISNSQGDNPVYNVYLAIAVNDPTQIASITVGSNTVASFTYGTVTWPAIAGGGNLPAHGVYPTNYALALFGDVDTNFAYYSSPGSPYGPCWAYRACIPVTITASSSMNANFKVHFDAQGALADGKPDSNPFSHDLTFAGSLSVPVLHPAIQVTKSGPTNAHEADTITYTITVTNTGDCSLSGVLVTDNLLGTIWSNGNLGVGQSQTFTPSCTVPSSSGDITNTVTASGSDTLGLGVSDGASWTVDVLHPGIYVTKSADKTQAYPGGTITYTIVVKNTGDCPLNNVLVSDSLLGNDIYSGNLAIGEIKTFTVTYTVPQSGSVVSNTVTACGCDVVGGVKGTVSYTASSAVTILHPGIQVTKSGPQYAHEGDAITYTITVNNPSSDTTMYKVSVIDSLLGDITSYFKASLGPSASDTETITSPVPKPSGNIMNTVTVAYEDVNGQVETATASWAVTVLHPLISVSKSGPQYAHESNSISYDITVTNKGDCSLYSVLVTDSTLEWSTTITELDVGATKTFTVPYTVPSPSTGISNTVTATGVDTLGSPVVSSSASWAVTVLHPKIQVTKSGPQYAHEGDTITYTIVVSNTGDCPLYGVVVSDSLLGNSIFTGDLAAGESETFTLTYHVPSPSTIISNTVTASGNDATNLSVSSSATCTVTVLHPGISVSKSGPANAHEGDLISYTITITNPSKDATMYKVSVVDSVLGDVTSRFPASLAPGASDTETLTYTVPSPSRDVTNVVTVQYKNDVGQPLIAAASWTVLVLHKVTFAVNGVGSGFPGTVLIVDGVSFPVMDLPLSFWWDDVTPHTFAFQSPLTVGSCKRYVWVSTTGLSNKQSDGSFIATVSGTITGNYKTQYHITFGEVGIGSDFTGTALTVDPLNDCYGICGLPCSYWWDDGSIHTFAFLSPLGEPYIWVSTTGLSSLQSGSITVSTCGSITGYYVRLLGFMTDSTWRHVTGFDTVWTPTDQSNTNFKLSTTNPAGFFYDIFIATPVTLNSQTVTYTISPDFVLQGTDPIQVWTGNARTGTRVAATISGNSITINGPIGPGSLDITISLTYGLAGNTYPKSTMAAWKTTHSYPASAIGCYVFRAELMGATTTSVLYDPTVVLGL